jgi:c-di-GMP-binding flagellar brake protein YcgR
VGAAHQLDIVTGNPVFVEIAGSKQKLPSRFVGFKEGKYVIIATPAGSQQAIPEQGGTITIKYVHDGAVIAFKASLMETLHKPDQLLFLAYPQEVTRQNLRQQKRYSCDYQARVSGTGSLVTGQLMDISSGGCCCRLLKKALGVNQPLPQKGEVVQVSIKLPEGDDWFQLPCTLSNVFNGVESIDFGLTFQSPDLAQQTQIKQLIFHTIKF